MNRHCQCEESKTQAGVRDRNVQAVPCLRFAFFVLSIHPAGSSNSSRKIASTKIKKKLDGRSKGTPTDNLGYRSHFWRNALPSYSTL